MPTQYPDDFSIFKPNAQGTGGALALSFSQRGVFLKIARQLGTQRLFDWGKAGSGKVATTINLGMADIGQILLALATKKEVSLFHDSSKFSSNLGSQKGLKITFNEQYGNFFFELWEKEGENTKRASLPLTPAEAIQMEYLLKWTLPYLLKWQIVDTSLEDSKGNVQAQEASQQQMPMENDVPAAISNVFPGAEVVPNTPKTREQKLVQIMQIAKVKLGAVNAEDAKTKVVGYTKLTFIDSNLDSILTLLMK